MNPSHRDSALHIRYPNRRNLLKPNSEPDILDRVSINGLDIEAEKLFLRHIIPSDAGEVPCGVDDAVILDSESAAASLRKGMAVDCDISQTTSLDGLMDVESEDDVPDRSRCRLVRLRQVEGDECAWNRVFPYVNRSSSLGWFSRQELTLFRQSDGSRQSWCQQDTGLHETAHGEDEYCLQNKRIVYERAKAEILTS